MSTPRNLVSVSILGAALGTSGGQAQGTPARGFTLGPPEAAVTVIAFTDFGCSACAQFAVETFPALRTEFSEPGRARWESVPVAMGFRHSKQALTAALCADAEGAFWPMHDLLFARQELWQKPRSPKAMLQNLALEVGIDTAAFAACYESGHFKSRVKQLTARGRKHGIRGTPAFLIGETWIYGAQPLSVFREALSRSSSTSGDQTSH